MTSLYPKNSIINLPQGGLRDNQASISSIGRHISLLEEMGASIVIDFNQCCFISYSSAVLLGALVSKAHEMHKEVRFRGLDESIGGKYLRSNGFTEAMGIRNSFPARSTAVPYRRYRNSSEVNAFCTYLLADWLTPDRINLSVGVRNRIVDHVAEAFVNVFHHAQSSIGAIVCGQWHPNIHSLNLAVLDLGVGIPHNVSTHLNQQSLSGKDALQLAFQPGFTTQTIPSVPRGLGLYNLKEFVRLNSGSLEVYSGNGYARLDTNEHPFYNSLASNFPGTLIQFAIKTDERYYMLESELDHKKMSRF